MKRAVLVLAGTLLAGCSSIPSSGPIVQGARVDAMQNDVNVRVIARPPQDGMSPEQVVRGFLFACASIADGDDTARQYLTSQASSRWKTQQLTQVYDIAGLNVVSERDGVRVSAPLLGRIDASRRYQVADVGATVSDVLHLSQVNGQWRIDKAPPALYLGEADVMRSFRVHRLFFLNAAMDRLVPEFAVLPISTSNVPAQLVRTLLAGPVDASLRTAIPAGTALVGGLQDFGFVTVPFSAAAVSATGSTRAAMLAQVAWTLTQMASVGSVRVTAAGQTLADEAGRTVFTAADLQSFDPARSNVPRSLVYIAKDAIWSLRNGIRTQLASGTPAAEAATTADGGLVLAVSATRKFLFAVRGRGPEILASGGDIAAPTALGPSEAWFIDRSSGGMFVWTPGMGRSQVTTTLPKRARLIDFSIAPDGARIAVIVNDGAATSLRVGFIERTGGAVRVTGLARVEQRLSAVASVSWSSESELVVLGAVGSAAVQPILVTLPLGTDTILGGPANPVSISAAPGQPIVVGDQSGQLWKLTDGKWAASELGASPRYAY